MINTKPATITVALTGASGLIYGLKLIEQLIAAHVRVYIVYSQAAQIVAQQEMQLTLPSRPLQATEWFMARSGATEGMLKVFGREEWFAPIASGGSPADAMVISPCTMGTLAAIAQGLAHSLIERAADVMLKEQRKLILVPRETPLSALHLENMLKLARLGVVILPPCAGFYTHPQNIDDMVNFVVARILDQLAIPNQLVARWGEPAR